MIKNHLIKRMYSKKVKNRIKSKKIPTSAFIDASNIIYGTRNEGWKVDFKKLMNYLSVRYNCKKIYYFAGIEPNHTNQQKFYLLLKKLGYELVLKPVKLYIQPDGKVVRKANCDVDLTFYAMRDKDSFKRGIFLTGDGDFEVLFTYLLEKRKHVIVIANAKRTAREIKKLVGLEFNDLGSLKETLKRK